MEIRGRWALVTGASSGIGRDIARELARRGCHCVLSARRADRLEEVARELRDQFGVQAEVETSDLMSPGAAGELHARLQRRGRQIDVLVNNAGFGHHGNFVDNDLDTLTGLVQLNIVALMQLCHLHVRDMVGRGGGYVMNVASIAGLSPVPSYAVYGASKAFVVSFNEAISLELGKSGVVVSALLPGPTFTEFFDVSGQRTTLYNRIMLMKSEDVARIGVEGMLQGRSTVIAGWRHRILMGLSALLPRRLNAWMSWQFMRND